MGGGASRHSPVRAGVGLYLSLAAAAKSCFGALLGPLSLGTGVDLYLSLAAVAKSCFDTLSGPLSLSAGFTELRVLSGYGGTKETVRKGVGLGSGAAGMGGLQPYGLLLLSSKLYGR